MNDKLLFTPMEFQFPDPWRVQVFLDILNNAVRSGDSIQGAAEAAKLAVAAYDSLFPNVSR